jgi:anti-sigma factor RsiW
MTKRSHPDKDMLMDYAGGDLPPDTVEEVESHLTGCGTCTAYVESLKRAFAALRTDPLPLPPDAYFASLAGRARHHAGRRRSRLVFAFAPGLAAAAAVVVLMWWIAGTPVLPVDGVEIIMAGMTTGEIVETVSADPATGSMILEDDAEGLDEVESYLQNTESIYDMLEGMTDAEKARLMVYLKQSMTRDTGTSGLVTGSMRKEC